MGAYVNFLGNEGGARVRTAYGEQKFARLQALKHRYDPTNFFHLSQTVPPNTAAANEPGIGLSGTRGGDAR
jgi:hypothetical protein